jgi:FixJ family two-component response regulator
MGCNLDRDNMSAAGSRDQPPMVSEPANADERKMARQLPLIAVVDDDASVRKALGRLLTACDFATTIFPSGQAFLDSLATDLPDCVVLDLQMPELNGLDVLAALARAGLALNVIMITGHDNPESRTRCLEAGVLACLPKPLDEVSFLRAVGEAIRRAPNPQASTPA